MPTLGELLIFALGVIVLAQVLTFVIDDLPWPQWDLPQWLADILRALVKYTSNKKQ